MVAAAGCAKARANIKPEPLSLEVPAPPPRVIVPPDLDPEPAQPPVSEPEPQQEKPARRPSQPRPDGKAGPARTEKKVEVPPPPVAEAVHPVPPPTATLHQALPGAPTEVERQVRDQLAQATGDLRRVDYLALNADAKSQYDTAKRFIEQAEQALKEKNLVFAAKVAEKAAGLAASLVGR